jgi:hypothetical protein
VNVINVADVYLPTDAELAVADEIEAERLEAEEVAVLATLPPEDPVDYVYRAEHVEG